MKMAKTRKYNIHGNKRQIENLFKMRITANIQVKIYLPMSGYIRIREHDPLNNLIRNVKFHNSSQQPLSVKIL